MKFISLFSFTIVSFGFLSCSSTELESQRQALLLQSMETSIAETEQLSKSKFQYLRENTNKKTHLRPIYRAAMTLSPKAVPLLDYLNQLANKNEISEIQIDNLENLIQQTRDSLVRSVYALHELNERIEMAGVKFSEKALKHIEKDLLINNAATINYHQLTKKTSKQEIDLLLTKVKLLTVSSICQIVHFFASNGRGGCGWIYDRIDVYAASSKPFVFPNEEYHATIAVGAFVPDPNYTIQVHGDSVAIQDGKAKYSETPTSSGTQSYTVKAQIKHPFTGAITDTLFKTFYYEVLPPKNNLSISIQ